MNHANKYEIGPIMWWLSRCPVGQRSGKAPDAANSRSKARMDFVIEDVIDNVAFYVNQNTVLKVHDDDREYNQSGRDMKKTNSLQIKDVIGLLLEGLNA